MNQLCLPQFVRKDDDLQTFFESMLLLIALYDIIQFMRNVYEMEKLRELLSLFCDFTEITITLFDSDLKPVLDVGEWKDYCLAIGKDKTRLHRCKECDIEHAKKAAEKRENIIYACHAGIAEAVAPIYIKSTDKTPSAYLMIGKFRDTDGKISPQKTIIEKAKFYNLDPDKMIEYWEKLPVIDSKRMNKVMLFLKLLLNDIIDEKLIRAASTLSSEQIADYVQEHIGEKITVEDLCELVSLNRYELYSLFKQYFNESPHSYISKQRLLIAQELLVTTDMTIQEISDRVGFWRGDAFSYFFKEKMKMGITPLQYRKAKRLQRD